MNQLQSSPSNEAPTPPPKDDYHAYLLRLWRVRESQGSHWRASLEAVQSGELHGFDEIEGLQDYLDEIAGTRGNKGESRRDSVSTE